MDFMSLLMSAMTNSDAISALAGKTGASDDQLSKLIKGALPMLLKSLTQNASSADGAQSLVNALSQHTNTKSMFDQIANADEADGEKIIGHILGGNREDVLNALSKESGMKQDQIAKALSAIAPALLSGLSAAASNGKKDDDGAFDLTDLAGMFGASASAKPSGLGAILGSLLGGAKEDDADINGAQLLSTLTALMK